MKRYLPKSLDRVLSFFVSRRDFVQTCIVPEYDHVHHVRTLYQLPLECHHLYPARCIRPVHAPDSLAPFDFPLCAEPSEEVSHDPL